MAKCATSSLSIHIDADIDYSIDFRKSIVLCPPDKFPAGWEDDYRQMCETIQLSPTEAQQRMRQHPKYSKPYYWAGFIMSD